VKAFKYFEKVNRYFDKVISNPYLTIKNRGCINETNVAIFQDKIAAESATGKVSQEN